MAPGSKLRQSSPVTGGPHFPTARWPGSGGKSSSSSADAAPRRLWEVARLLRPQQWLKNLLLFLPLALSHRLGDLQAVGLAVAAWGIFSATASAVYVLNDWLDRQADRNHPVKCRRPLAAGTVPSAWAAPLMGGLLLSAAAASWLLPWRFAALLAVYFCLTTLYSVWAKRQPMLDVLLLAGLYTLRILAGGAAVEVLVSDWLLGFSLFLFASLAFAKRCAELRRLSNEGASTAQGRGYRVEDMSLLETLGATSGYLSVLVLALYIHSSDVAQLYATPRLLWLVCPVVLYWISRLWLLARRGELSEDPVVFAARDPVSLLTVAATAALALAARVTW